MDGGDFANSYADTYLRAAICNRPKPGQANGESARFCDECGEPIPEGRREAMPGCRLCIDCQAETE